MSLEYREIQELLALSRAGLSNRQVAEKIGCSRQTVKTYRPRYKVPNLKGDSP